MGVCYCRIYDEYRRTHEWLNLCFHLCCVAMFRCFVALVQTVDYQKVLTGILNVFGCHCRPLVFGAWLISSLFTYYCQCFVRLLFMQCVGFSFIYLFVLYIVEPKDLLLSAGL